MAATGTRNRMSLTSWAFASGNSLGDGTNSWLLRLETSLVQDGAYRKP
jgi:hypothetical protein